MNKTVKTKISISVLTAKAVLNCIHDNCVDLFDNSEFKERFISLRQCVDGMLDTGMHSEIIDTYCVIEQVSPEKTPKLQ